MCTAPPWHDPRALERLAELTSEFADRLRDDPALARDLDDAAARFDTVALALRDASDRANAAHTRARTATSVTGLLDLATTCPITGPP